MQHYSLPCQGRTVGAPQRLQVFNWGHKVPLVTDRACVTVKGGKLAMKEFK